MYVQVYVHVQPDIFAHTPDVMGFFYMLIDLGECKFICLHNTYHAELTYVHAHVACKMCLCLHTKLYEDTPSPVPPSMRWCTAHQGQLRTDGF